MSELSNNSKKIGDLVGNLIKLLNVYYISGTLLDAFQRFSTLMLLIIP